MTPVRSLLAALLTVLLVLPAAAAAQEPAPASIDGNPLRILADPNGSVQVAVGGRDVYEFCCSSTAPSAGFNVVIDPGGSSAITWGAYGGTRFPNPDAGPALAPGDPSTLTTTWTLTDGSGAPALRVTQLLAYSNGRDQFDSTYTVQNVNNQRGYAIRPYVGGDLTIRGSDTGVGIANLEPNRPPRFVGGLNQEVGGAGVFVEQTPWAHFEEGNYYTVRTDANGAGLNDSVATENLDNGAAVQWDGTLAPAGSPGDTAEYRVGWRFVDTFGITPAVATQRTGNDQRVTADIGDVNGNPIAAGTKVRWSVSGANPTITQQTTVTDSRGRTAFSYLGGTPGEDTVTGFADANGNGTHDPAEPQATARVTWDGPPAPTQGSTLNVRAQKGRVLVKLPSGGGFSARVAAKRLGVPLAVAAKSYVPLTRYTQVPVGSFFDTTHGTVRLLAASSPTRSTGGSPFSGGSFRGGIFRTSQTGSQGLSQMSMSGPLACRSRVPRGGIPKVVATRKRRRSRTLFGNAHGRFRTRGRNSSATVRGTSWVQKDTCKGTLTTVKRGSVLVRDFAKKKNVVVSKGRRYLAKPLAPKRRR